MTTTFSYTTQYTLDKDHFRECYTQSLITDNSVGAYFKSILLSVSGILLVLFTDVNSYAAWFLLLLGALEALSVYYQKAWWVMRQMLSKAANSEVTLTIDELGITSQSLVAELKIEWQTVKALTVTESGWLVEHDEGKNYISNSCLTAPVIEFMAGKSRAQVP
jgi:hypothetical protein